MFDENSRDENFCHETPLALTHLKAVLKQNRTMNLTSIRDIEAGKVLHIEDSLAVLPEIMAAPEGPMADLGSGAGFPGIPLALTTKRKTTLIEANQKKSRFLQEFLEKHSLTGCISVVALRSEDLARLHPATFAVITARAVSELPVLLELAAPLLITGGQFVALKGRIDKEELRRGKLAADKLGLKEVCVRNYTLSDGTSHRCVLVFEKQGESKVVVPRRPGMAAKRPLA